MDTFKEHEYFRYAENVTSDKYL